MFESEFSFVSTAIVPTSDTISRGSFHVLNGVLVVVDVVSLVAVAFGLPVELDTDSGDQPLLNCA